MSAAYGGHSMSNTPRAIRQGISVVSCAEYKNNFLYFLGGGVQQMDGFVNRQQTDRESHVRVRVRACVCVRPVGGAAEVLVHVFEHDVQEGPHTQLERQAGDEPREAVSEGLV